MPSISEEKLKAFLDQETDLTPDEEDKFIEAVKSIGLSSLTLGATDLDPDIDPLAAQENFSEWKEKIGDAKRALQFEIPDIAQFQAGGGGLGG